MITFSQILSHIVKALGEVFFNDYRCFLKLLQVSLPILETVFGGGLSETYRLANPEYEF